MLVFATRTLAEAVLSVLLAWPTFTREPAPETLEDRTQRLMAATIAITEASVERPAGWQPVQVAAVLLTLGWYESRFAAYVGDGRCSEGPEDARCDPHPKTKEPRARTYWQLHQAACPALWVTEPGSFDAVRSGARCASRLWVGAFYRCRKQASAGPLAGAFAGYAGGAAGCRWEGGVRRVQKLHEIAGLLRSKMARPSGQLLDASPRDGRLAIWSIPAGLPQPHERSPVVWAPDAADPKRRQRVAERLAP